MKIEIEYLEIPLTVFGFYSPGETEIMYDGTGGGYPGSASEFDIVNILVSDSSIDICDLLSNKQMDEISEIVIEKIENE